MSAAPEPQAVQAAHPASPKRSSSLPSSVPSARAGAPAWASRSV